MKRLLVLALAAGCGATARVPPAAPTPVVMIVSGGVLVPLACGGAAIERHDCLARLPAAGRARSDGRDVELGGAATSRCGQPGRAVAAARDGALAIWPPGATLVAPAADPAPADLARIEAQLTRTDPSLVGPARVAAVLVADLDGDRSDDTAYAAGIPGLQAVLLAASSFPARLKILQFSDDEPYQLLGAVDLDPARAGMQLVVRTGGDIDVIRATGEVVGGLRCAQGSRETSNITRRSPGS